MDRTQVEKERAANNAYVEFLGVVEALTERAQEVHRLYREAGMVLPPTVSEILGEKTLNGHVTTPKPEMVLTPPLLSIRPPEAKSGWINAPIADATPTILVLAILRSQEAPIRSDELFKELLNYQPNANYGSLLNIGKRLDGELIGRSSRGWTLLDKAKAPVIHGQEVWGPVGVFTKQEIAAHRRLLICNILQDVPGGLQVTEIARRLQATGFKGTPINKDLLKIDMLALENDGRVKKVGNTRKWALVDNRDSSGSP